MSLSLNHIIHLTHIHAYTHFTRLMGFRGDNQIRNKWSWGISVSASTRSMISWSSSSFSFSSVSLRSGKGIFRGFCTTEAQLYRYLMKMNFMIFKSSNSLKYSPVFSKEVLNSWAMKGVVRRGLEIWIFISK